MMNWMRGVLTAAGAAGCAAALIGVSACNSNSRSVSRESNGQLIGGMAASAPRPAAAYAPASSSELSQFGATGNSLGLSTILSEHDDPASASARGIPLLGDIPIAGRLFDPSADGDRSADDFTHGFQARRTKIGSQIPDRAPAQPAPELARPNMEVALLPGQELLVIERRHRGGGGGGGDPYAPAERDDLPGSGTMMTRWCDPADSAHIEREVPVPLRHTDVHASIAGPISSVKVTQEFHNPYSSKIEALYVFPLPDDAAVNDFVMTIGPRSIRGVIREREQAEQIYTQARAQGYHASLMTQERSNIFTQRVANIEPGERIDVSVTYFGPLTFRDSGYEFVFPIVVGPRYNPASTMAGVPRFSEPGAANSGTGIGSAPGFATNDSTQGTTVGYLRPHERCGRDISISVDLNAGVRLEQVESPTHHVVVRTGADLATAHIDLSPADSIPNRDFVLRYRVAGGQVKGGMITARDERIGGAGENYFSMVLVPPSDLRYCPRGPVEMIFVVDCSGSMSGEPLELARRSVRTALSLLRAGDTFQIIRFSDKAEFLSQAPERVNPENIQRADRYVAGLQTGGGTELLNGLEPALEERSDPKRSRFLCVLSDGFLGNEPEVLGQLKRKLGDSKVFAVAIGAAPNRALMNGLARLGRGCAATVSNPADADEVMRLFSERVSNAAMTDLKLDFGSLDAKDVYPKRLPDLYVGRPIIITGRFSGQPVPGAQVRISGRAGTERTTIDVPILWSDPQQSRALPLMWARARITELDEESSWGRKAGAGSPQGPNRSAITDLSLKYGIMSAYTSFVAVDCSERTGGSFGTTVQVPVPIPAGTRYETTVGDR